MKPQGLERRYWIDPIDDFVRQHGQATPRWAVLLTYEISMDVLARSVLPALSRRGRVFRSVVLADQGALEAALKSAPDKIPGSVNLHPVQCRRGGVFHPKLALLRAGRNVLACFGSANITSGGLGSNLELWTHTQSPTVISGLLTFLSQVISSKHLGLDDGARRSIKRAFRGISPARSEDVWSSLDEPFAARLRKGRERRSRQATIISPMYAGAGGVRAARRAIPAHELQLYTTLNVPVPHSTVFAYNPPSPADQGSDDPEAFPSRLHSKAYVFAPQGRGDAIAWVGSANFTAQAITKSVSGGGNVELMVKTALPPDEVDALRSDLRQLFTRPKAEDVRDPFEPASIRPAKATILTCELFGSPDEPCLVVQTIIENGVVEIEHQRRRLKVQIRDSKGRVEGKPLRKFLSDLDWQSSAQVLIFRQVVGKALVPIAVNVPHVPDDGGGRDSHGSVDAWIDDLLGRVRAPSRKSSNGEDTEDVDIERPADVEVDEEEVDIERRLDETRHQGELDRLAVKAAMLKKLVLRNTRTGFERLEITNDIVAAVLATSPPHLKRSIRMLFRGLAEDDA